MENNQKNNQKGNMGCGVVIFIIILLWLFSSLGSCNSSSSSDNSKYCSSCNRTFTDSDNKSSISWRNMCENCYENYLFVSEVQKELENW